MCLKQALSKSCIHKVGSSFNNQVSRLSKLGLPSHVTLSVCDTLVPVDRKNACDPILTQGTTLRRLHKGITSMLCSMHRANWPIYARCLPRQSQVRVLKNVLYGICNVHEIFSMKYH